jgi:hypothetical protein
MSAPAAINSLQTAEFTPFLISVIWLDKRPSGDRLLNPLYLVQERSDVDKALGRVRFAYVLDRP